MKILNILRDPIWQMIGVLVSVVTFLATAIPSLSGNQRDLIAYPIRTNQVVDNWLPKDKLTLQIDGSNIDSKAAIGFSYVFANKSEGTIQPEDYNGPIEISPGTGMHLIQVASCANSFAQACTGNSNTLSGGSYVATSWESSGNSWIATGPMLNKDDLACVQVVTEPINPIINETVPPAIHAHIKGYNFIYYPTSEKYYKSLTKWYHYLQTRIVFDGYEAYIYSLVLFFMLFANLRLANSAGISTSDSFKSTTLVVILILFCASTSEILVYIFVKHAETPHWLVWPLLALHAIIIWYFVKSGLKRRNAI